MNVTRVEMKGVMRHADTKLDLPKHGVVLVTGPNGAGKSSIVEAVSVGLWGESLRSTPAWSGPDGSIVVNTDKATVSRSRRKGKVGLSWAVQGDTELVEYENTSKAQQALEKVVGPFDVWRRSHVFSSQDAAHFTLSTDGERKRLLESILGIERFDAAVEKCRKELKEAEGGHQELSSELRVLEAKLAGEQRRLADAQLVLHSARPGVDKASVQTKMQELDRMLRSCSSDLAGLNSKLTDALGVQAKAEAAAHAAKRELQRASTDRCPTCGQSLQQNHNIDSIKEKVAAANAEAELSSAKARELRSSISGEIEELQAERDALQFKRAKLKVQLDEAEASEQRHNQAQWTIDKIEAGIRELEDTTKLKRSNYERCAKDVKELLACEQVLGLRGVRSQVLSGALGGVEGVANFWLSRIAGAGLKLRLKPYSEKKSGGVSDAISLEVEGAGNGYGYRASSGGERRRIDVALLLALAEVASAAQGLGGGTLFMDEVFDALDDVGVDAVVSVIQELAKDRAVVVISHSQALVEKVPATLRLHVEAGKIS